MEIKAILEQEQPQGIFASDDMTAILTMKITDDLGIKVPQDLKIVGYDGTQFVENYFPQLTTIKQPIKEIAELLVDVLLAKIAGKEVQESYILPISLLTGKSL